jgi:hypothetical protein
MIAQSCTFPFKDGKAWLPLDNSSPFDKDFKRWIEESPKTGWAMPEQDSIADPKG